MTAYTDRDLFLLVGSGCSMPSRSAAPRSSKTYEVTALGESGETVEYTVLAPNAREAGFLAREYAVRFDGRTIRKVTAHRS
jgi:hypothetical protein